MQALLVLMASCAAHGESAPEIRVMMAKDILSRMEHDFFHYASKSQNVAKLLSDCVFQAADLTGNGTNEFVVKLNWYSDGSFGIAKGHNYVCGAHEQGQYFVYAVRDKQPTFLGIMQGNAWRQLPSKSRGWIDLESSDHEGMNEAIIFDYKYSKGNYRTVSSILYQFDENGNRKPLKVLSIVPSAPRPAVRIAP
jgi:hypothetical protein